MSINDRSSLTNDNCFKIDLDKSTLATNTDDGKFTHAVEHVDKCNVTLYLKNGDHKLTDDIVIQHDGVLRTYTVIEYIMDHWPMPIDYLHSLLDGYIKKNKYDLVDRESEITVDFSILLEKISDTNILKALLKSTRRYRSQLMDHPLVEAFLDIKWVTSLRPFYTGIVMLYFVFVSCLTWMALTIYTPATHQYEVWIYVFLYFLMTCMIIQELLFIAAIIWTKNFIGTIKKPIWLLNWTSKGLWIVVVNTDHSILNRDWPKIVTAIALLFAWMEITVLLSNYPEGSFVFHMFSAVVGRAIKVFLLFGCQIIIGFSLAFWIMFHGQPYFSNNYLETLAKTIAMTSELEYDNMIQSMTESNHKIILQVIIIVYIFFVPIVMMNFLLALIISDTADLKTKGRVKRMCNTIELVHVLDCFINLMTACGVIIRRPTKPIWKIYPAKPIAETKGFSKNISEKICNIFLNKDKCEKRMARSNLYKRPQKRSRRGYCTVMNTRSKTLT